MYNNSNYSIGIIEKDELYKNFYKNTLNQLSTIQFFYDLEYFIKFTKTNPYPNLIIIDIHSDDQTYLIKIINYCKEIIFKYLLLVIISGFYVSSIVLEELLKSGINSFLKKPFEKEKFLLLLKHIIDDNQNKINANSLTGIPGIYNIKRIYKEKLNNQKPFVISYFDVDNFKPCNDYIGLDAGDKIITNVANLFLNFYKFHSIEQYFIGHLGGDDFILLGNEHVILKVISICKIYFNHFLKEIFSYDDIKKGYYRTQDRDGIKKKFPLLSFSFVIIKIDSNYNISWTSFLKHTVDVKKIAKNIEGNSTVYCSIFEEKIYILNSY